MVVFFLTKYYYTEADGETGRVVGTSMKEFKTTTKYFSKECLTELSLDLISCRVKGEGLIQGHVGEYEVCDICSILYMLNATV